MIGKNISYSLKTGKTGLPQLSYDIGNKILFEDNSIIKIDLGDEIVTLKKYQYINTPYTKKFQIFDNGNVFFALCTKQVNTDYIFDKLMVYACFKIYKNIAKKKNNADLVAA